MNYPYYSLKKSLYNKYQNAETKDIFVKLNVIFP